MRWALRFEADYQDEGGMFEGAYHHGEDKSWDRTRRGGGVMSDYAYDEGYRAGMQKMREVGQRRIEELEAKLAKAMQVVEMPTVLGKGESK